MPLRILAVDDSEAVLRATVRILSRIGEVSKFEDPAAALRSVESGSDYDVVVSDVMMPGMTGFELQERVRAVNAALASRFVFVSGGVDPAWERRFAEAEYKLVKPFATEDLRAVVLRVAGRAP